MRQSTTLVGSTDSKPWKILNDEAGPMLFGYIFATKNRTCTATTQSEMWHINTQCKTIWNDIKQSNTHIYIYNIAYNIITILCFFNHWVFERDAPDSTGFSYIYFLELSGSHGCLMCFQDENSDLTVEIYVFLWEVASGIACTISFNRVRPFTIFY